MKLFRFLVFALLLICTFFVGVYLRDAIYDQWLRSNIETFQIGMTEEEIVSRIGQPGTTYIGDIGPGIYWCYPSRSFENNPDYCGYALEMSSTPRKLVKVLN